MKQLKSLKKKNWRHLEEKTSVFLRDICTWAARWKRCLVSDFLFARQSVIRPNCTKKSWRSDYVFYVCMDKNKVRSESGYHLKHPSHHIFMSAWQSQACWRRSWAARTWPPSPPASRTRPSPLGDVHIWRPQGQASNQMVIPGKQSAAKKHRVCVNVCCNLSLDGRWSWE